MKKLIIVIVLLLLIGGGAGAYYYFFMMQEEPVAEVVEEEPAEEEELHLVHKPEPVIKKDMVYYVSSDRLNVRSYPDGNSLIRSVLRKGDPVTALEVKGDWVRFSDYMVHESGKDIADWIHMEFLSASKPVITDEDRRKTMTALIKKSDDFVQYQEQFISATQKLIDNGNCSFEDFELLGGWLISVTYKPQPVYFVYCGGTGRNDKVYLNAETGEIFYP
ncbi:SH3 domain-containing protein [Vibrio sp. JC009]|uniref:SH3 domain-containing protein n=1 Tax=Vibrio sp. JC009 TaxID=2912314 RepID=UPI0023B124AB|nr:SH3 domain-containing protein [Vibrio sp. JC009]WED24204.1 SH3 domain-containing protein [Vibrio sp. JC009]